MRELMICFNGGAEIFKQKVSIGIMYGRYVGDKSFLSCFPPPSPFPTIQLEYVVSGSDDWIDLVTILESV